MIRRYFLIFQAVILFVTLFSFTNAAWAQWTQNHRKLKVLIIDGRSISHPHWRTWSPLLLKQLDDSDLFYVDIYTAAPEGEPLENFNPRFNRYDVVVSTYDGDSWPNRIKRNLEGYIRKGGGLVVIHAADNAFPQWYVYNRMIGLGGWGKRNETVGPYRYIDNEGKIIIEGYPGPAGQHGPQHPFIVNTYSKRHPIMVGIPEAWMHVSDILYGKLRGPGEAMTILATAYSDPKFEGTGRNEPVMMAIKFGTGRIFHTTLGHDSSAISCIGFMTTFVRGCEWAATGKVTFPIPENFPTTNSTSSLKY